MVYEYDQILFSSDVTAVGHFDCPRTARHFTNTGPVTGYLLAFPRTAVEIRHLDRHESIVADCNVVTIYNDGQEYERYALSDYGDCCDWIAFGASTIAESLHDVGIRHPNDPVRLFNIASSISPPEAYASMRRLVTGLQRDASPDRVAIEETGLHVLHEVLARAYCKVSARSAPRRSTTNARHRALVRKTQRLLAECYAEKLSLPTLAAEANVSAYHLCRVFRRTTGVTINAYLTQLRLRASLATLARGNASLTTLGVRVGFSDHSHYSSAFRRTFDMTPSSFRRQLNTGSTPQLAN